MYSVHCDKIFFMDNISKLALAGEPLSELPCLDSDGCVSNSHPFISYVEKLHLDTLHPSIFIISYVVLLWTIFFLLKKEYYVSSSIVITAYVLLFWLIISLSSNTYVGYVSNNYSEILVFFNNILIPILILFSLGLFIFGVYRLIRKRLSS